MLLERPYCLVNTRKKTGNNFAWLVKYSLMRNSDHPSVVFRPTTQNFSREEWVQRPSVGYQRPSSYLKSFQFVIVLRWWLCALNKSSINFYVGYILKYLQKQWHHHNKHNSNCVFRLERLINLIWDLSQGFFSYYTPWSFSYLL